MSLEVCVFYIVYAIIHTLWSLSEASEQVYTDLLAGIVLITIQNGLIHTDQNPICL